LNQDNEEIIKIKSKKIKFNGVSSDSRSIKKGNIFFAIPGNEIDGSRFINQAIKKGAAAIVVPSYSKERYPKNTTVIKAKDIRKSLSLLAFEINKNNIETKIGITGTNGKTTTAFYLNQLIGSDNLFIGTIDEKQKYSFTNEKILTTPKLFNVAKLISLQKENISSVSLEVSSHALDQNRLGDLKFLVSGFTNLSQDHLDYHGSIENYLNSKAKLFQQGVSEKFVYIDSPESTQIVSATNIESFSIGTNDYNDVRYKEIDEQILKFTIDSNQVECQINLSGPKFIENFLLAFSMAYYSNLFELEDLIHKSQYVVNPPGRFETINRNNKTVIIDYAHTPGAIKEAIKYAQNKYEKVNVILGAGGDRDKGKRMKMGEASSNADYVIITNDNPRNEDPLEISKNILEGIPLNKSSDVILDRKEAIHKGVQLLKENEVLLVLGKGHEKYQEIDNKFIPFDDVQITKEIMELEN